MSIWRITDRGSKDCTGGGDKSYHKGKKIQEEDLQIAEKGRVAKGKGKGKDIPY